MKQFQEDHLDILQNLEFGIIQVYRADPSLLDADAKDAIDALARYYRAEEEAHTPPVLNLGERAERVFRSVQQVCEWRLGRASWLDAPVPQRTLPLDELVRCLREIQKSVPRWTQQLGRRGYLEFIKEFQP